MYVQNDTLLLADVFENLGNMCFKMYKFDPANFSSAPRLAQEACLRIHRKEIRIINRYWYVIDCWKRNQSRNMSCNNRHIKVNNKYMKPMMKI